MIAKLQSWFFHKALAKVPKKSTSNFKMLNEGKNIGILYEFNDVASHDIVKRFRDNLQKSGNKNVNIFGFVPTNEPKGSTEQKGRYYKSDVNWYNVPVNRKIESFINQQFDVLIVLCTKYLPHFEYILAHSKSAFTIGPLVGNSQTYLDLSIEMNPSFTIQNLIDAIVINVNKLAFQH